MENLKSQITMWKETAQKRAEALSHTEMTQAEKIAGIQKMFEEEIIFKDAEIANLRKLTVSKIEEKKLVGHLEPSDSSPNKMDLFYFCKQGF